MDFSKLSREDWMVGGGRHRPVIGLLAFPWYSGLGRRFSARPRSRPAALAIWAVLALIVLIAIARRPGARALQPADAAPDHAARPRA